jgi:hypothetical protein
MHLQIGMKYTILLIFGGLLFLFRTTGRCEKIVQYTVETGQTCQTMEHFGASDAWSIQFVGLWPLKQ